MTSLYPFSKNFINITWTNVWKTYIFLDYFWIALLSNWFDYRSKDAIQHIMMYELWAYKVMAWLSKDVKILWKTTSKQLPWENKNFFLKDLSAKIFRRYLFWYLENLLIIG